MGQTAENTLYSLDNETLARGERPVFLKPIVFTCQEQKSWSDKDEPKAQGCNAVSVIINAHRDVKYAQMPRLEQDEDMFIVIIFLKMTCCALAWDKPLKWQAEQKGLCLDKRCWMLLVDEPWLQHPERAGGGNKEHGTFVALFFPVSCAVAAMRFMPPTYPMPKHHNCTPGHEPSYAVQTALWNVPGAVSFL